MGKIVTKWWHPMSRLELPWWGHSRTKATFDGAGAKYSTFMENLTALVVHQVPTKAAPAPNLRSG